MPDEIDLLRTFRSDTPAPGEAAWGKARAAVTAATGPVAPQRRPRPRLRLRTAVIAGAVAISAAVVAGVLVTVLPGSPSLGPAPSLHKTLTTAWQPAQALPSGPTGLKESSGQWRLTSYLSPRGWQENTSSPKQAGGLTCPTARTCYVEGNSATSGFGPHDVNALYVSGDDGQSWSVLPVPAGVTFTSDLACTTGSDCVAGGLYYGHQGVYLSTASGGHSWRVTPLGAGADQIIDLTCTSATSCRGLLRTSLAGPWGPVAAWRVQLISTANGGRHFAVSSFPAGTSMQSLSCPTAAHCVAFGIPLPGSNAPEGTDDAATGVVLITDDGGVSWQRAPLPRNVGAAVPELTCSDAAHCALLGYVIGPGSQSGSMPVSGSGKYTYSDQYSVVGFSADGGRSWTIRKLPKNIPGPFLNSLACPTAKVCYAVGQDDTPQKVGTLQDAGSAVIAVTRDGGQTWQPVRFAVPSNVPSGMESTFDDIGEIQCPQAGVCVATGVYEQGSMSSVPIYTLRG